MAGSWAGSQEGFALVQPAELPVQAGDQFGGGGGPPVLHSRFTRADCTRLRYLTECGLRTGAGEAGGGPGGQHPRPRLQWNRMRLGVVAMASTLVWAKISKKTPPWKVLGA